MDERHVTFIVPKLPRVRLGSISRIRLYHGLRTVDGSRFRQAICEFVMLPWNMPEPNLRDLSLISSQHTFGRGNQPSCSSPLALSSRYRERGTDPDLLVYYL
jgi:hypothetical protein